MLFDTNAAFVSGIFSLRVDSEKTNVREYEFHVEAGWDMVSFIGSPAVGLQGLGDA